MKTKFLAVAAFLAISVTNAFAASSTIALTSGGNGKYTGFFGASETGAFDDTYTFTPALSSSTVDALVTSIGFSTQTNIDFTHADLNGHALTIQHGIIDYAFTSSPIALSGPLVLHLMGTSGSNASYSGTINVQSAVPEPETYAMMLAGLGFVGFMARRRKAAKAA